MDTVVFFIINPLILFDFFFLPYAYITLEKIKFKN